MTEDPKPSVEYIMGPLTVDRIRSEHELCSSTLGGCPFCILIDEIDRLKRDFGLMRDILNDNA